MTGLSGIYRLHKIWREKTDKWTHPETLHNVRRMSPHPPRLVLAFIRNGETGGEF